MNSLMRRVSLLLNLSWSTMFSKGPTPKQPWCRRQRATSAYTDIYKLGKCIIALAMLLVNSIRHFQGTIRSSLQSLHSTIDSGTDQDIWSWTVPPCPCCPETSPPVRRAIMHQICTVGIKFNTVEELTTLMGEVGRYRG